MKARLFLFIFLILSGCAVDYCAYPRSLPSAAIENALENSSENIAYSCSDGLSETWWEIFQDAALASLIETAIENNPTLQAAVTQIQIARARSEAVGSALYPFVDLTADTTRQKLSKTGLIPGTPSAASTQAQNGTSFPIPPGGLIPFYFTETEAALNFSYDLDLWGKNRNALAAAIGETQAKIADAAWAQLILSLSVAESYFKYQIDSARKRLAEAMVKNREEYLNLIQGRVKNNLDNELTLNSVEITVTDARTHLIQMKRDQEIHAIQLKAYLAGNFDEEIETVCFEQTILPPVPVPLCLPLHLISHRPDLISKLWQIESAGKEIDIAKAGFYPDVNLMGFAGYQTIHIEDWFKWESGYGAVGPALTLPIFEGGLLEAKLHGSVANYDLAILQYNAAVVNAAKETLESLTLINRSQEALKEAVRHSGVQKRSYVIRQQRLANGIDTRMDTLNSEMAYLSAKDREIVTKENVYLATLSLIKAIGGGYENPLWECEDESMDDTCVECES